MAREPSDRQVQKALRDLEHATHDVQLAAAEYLQATIELAKLNPVTWKRARPHILSVAKHADNLHKHVVKRR